MIEIYKGSKEWEVAQKGEMKFWAHALDILPLSSELEKVERNYAAERANACFTVHGEPYAFYIEAKTCLEVGSGPYPFLLAWTNAKKRIAIDPLFSYYSKFTTLKANEKHNGVFFFDGKAEDFEYKKERAFDIIICSNSIDHCDEPNKVRDMMMRNLAQGGRIYIDLYLRAPASEAVHPHGWETPEAFCNWFNESKTLKFEYIRIVENASDKSDDRLFTRVEHA